jgi:hypothetical protein
MVARAGSETGRHLDALAPGEFVLTTYGTLRQDAEQLAVAEWGLAAADEAQHAKNPYSHTARALRTVTPQARVAPRQCSRCPVRHGAHSVSPVRPPRAPCAPGYRP